MWLRLTQFMISIIVGCAMFGLLADDPNPKVKYLGGFAAGLLAAWAFTHVLVWLRLDLPILFARTRKLLRH